jgi:hypothetical protein
MNMGIKFHNKSPYKIRDMEEMRQFKKITVILPTTIYTVLCR